MPARFVRRVDDKRTLACIVAGADGAGARSQPPICVPELRGDPKRAGLLDNFQEGHVGERHICERRTAAEPIPSQVRSGLSPGGRWIRTIGTAARKARCPNSLLARNIQGISFDRSPAAYTTAENSQMRQCLTSEFPTHPNKEFFVALQGIESGDHGIFLAGSGKRVPRLPRWLHRGLAADHRRTLGPASPTLET
jgi:hypothetical protein